MAYIPHIQDHCHHHILLVIIADFRKKVALFLLLGRSGTKNEAVDEVIRLPIINPKYIDL